jgi:bifunctional UDP-N-acetylglucosamine pyrophosphorylase/glucosamine-1-phosphate N-acetyltransferase
MPASAGRPLTALVLAAGLGTRMRSRTVKVLHPVWGRPMLSWVLDALEAITPERRVVVLGHQADRVREATSAYAYETVVQREQRGTGHAVMCARPLLEQHPGDVLILNGDLPLLRGTTLSTFLARHRDSGASLSVLTTEVPDAARYGRIVRQGGELARIVEAGDASPAELAIHEINCGVYIASTADLLAAIDDLTTANAQGEYYLTDAVERLARSGKRVAGIRHADAGEVLGVNDRAELAQAVAILAERKRAALMDAGVMLLDPPRTFIDPRARIGRDTVIYPGVWIEGDSVIGEECVIHPHSRLTEVRIGDRVTIKDSCVIQSAEIHDGSQVGPFAHLRPGTYLCAGVKVGNFVETKKAFLGEGSKAMHLSYLGDAELGRDVNVGAGTITCNYDGQHKHRTVLEDGVFIGSDTQLVAPVRVGAGAYVGAGSTVVKDVPPGSLALSRAPQRTIEGWVERKRQAKGSKKPARKAKGEAGKGDAPAAGSGGEDTD